MSMICQKLSNVTFFPMPIIYVLFVYIKLLIKLKVKYVKVFLTYVIFGEDPLVKIRQNQHFLLLKIKGK